jgi:hypothetical protein
VGFLVQSGLEKIGRRLAEKLSRPIPGYHPYTPSDYKTLCATLVPGDILLVEGDTRLSSTIKYLTQSTWSHAALYVGDAMPAPADGTEKPRLIEVLITEGCIAVPLSKYQNYNTRICRAVSLTDADRATLVAFMIGKIGLQYDMHNIFDLLRYFLPTPPVPTIWRRKMLSIGSGDPTRAICSSLIALAYQSINYPILPNITLSGKMGDYAREQIFHIRDYSLYAPRDFDLSPYFEVVKPTIRGGFDHRKLVWDSTASPQLDAPKTNL